MKFEEIFKVPATHVLKQTKFRSKGTLGQNDKWEHEEYDADGGLVARYSSWHNTNLRTLNSTSGYEKHSPEGKLLHASKDLPI